ncbi:MazG nucleotide pyrophosphohydrolase domain-containing protein [Roseobacter sp. SK209-2-6]|uniref:MazG nucleotide pyrophosphohydrolase domain-containing protein n=1 Tax=Roseobacter sp. SK209-2-6 TaxID=388739 RepID=UPI001E283D99|nr:MazG nucleotide pyrophosphohydrolase domain-containing protein [Roseobacter sp. SK209-2-6]
MSRRDVDLREASAPDEARDLAALSDLVREVSDLYAERFAIRRDPAWYLGKMSEELGEVTAAYLKLQGQGRGTVSRRDLEDELGDLLGFVLLFADWQGVDIGAALQRKWGAYLPVEE